ncbi:MAG: hypothetical protein ACD_79C00793G0003, partial [uncultured bacterium]
SVKYGFPVEIKSKTSEKLTVCHFELIRENQMGLGFYELFKVT